ncbi:CD3337/EF1877 family mobilome membrane protein, partial [Mediterraneibacter gnavus]
LLSASFIAYAPNYISKINDFSADISSSALSLGTKIVLPDSNSKGKDSVDLIRDSLFSIQVKQPWLLLQYGESDIETLGSDRVESLLSESPDTDDREDVVIEEIEDKDNEYLSVTKTMTRLGMVVFLFIFNIGISAFVFLLTGMMIFSQVLFIIYAMFLPISFILSMIPTYEGMAKKALTKLFNTIMMRAGITLIITTAFSISTMFYSISSGYPFFMVAFLQIVTFAGIYFKLGDLMAMFSLQSSDTQQVSRRIMRHPYMFLNRRARRLERKIGRTVAAGAAGGVAGAAASSSSSTKKADSTKQTGNTHTRANHNTSASYGGGNSKPPALPDSKSQKPPALPDKKSQTDSSQTVHSSQSNTQESQSTSKRGIVDKKSVLKQQQSEKQNPQRPIVDKAQDKQESKDKEQQAAGSATKRAAPVHERPATTPVPVKSDSQATSSKPERNVKERPVTVTKEQPQSSKTKEPVTKSQTQVIRESHPADKHSQAATDGLRQTVQRKSQTKTVQKKNITQSTVKKSTSKKGGKK